ncbi:MAG: DUF4231 domain-containing protein [Humibacillus sp.]|nr:DUF4231 domain-containing protein [Humibacillus sp.]MDN5777351.1 DUF4231 domain-containing protein [Humibacillus sp.]
MTIWGRARTKSAIDRGEAAWQGLGDILPVPSRPEDRDDLLWQELETYLRYYNTAAGRARVSFYGLKVLTLSAGAAVTVLAAISAPAALTAGVGAAIVVLEGAQQLFQFHRNWLSYRSAAEALRQHAFQYIASVKPYDDPATRRAQLASALQAIIANELGAWSTTMLNSPATGDTTTPTTVKMPDETVNRPDP